MPLCVFCFVTSPDYIISISCSLYVVNTFLQLFLKKYKKIMTAV
nr:MAG TPA: hypothetical protein [Caudoviricetes sp.]